MADTIIMPKQGNTVETCVINTWLKNEGDTITVGEVLCEIETDKSTMSVESTASGTILKLLYDAGDDVPVLEPIAIVGEAGEEITQPSAATHDSMPQDSKNADLAGAQNNTQNNTDTRITHQGDSAMEPADSIRTTQNQATDTASSLQYNRNAAKIISPRAKNLAQQHSVQYDILHGTGPRGRVIEQDIRSELEKPVQGNDAAFSDGADAVIHTLQGVKKVTARHMKESLASATQLTCHRLAHAEKLLQIHSYFKSVRENTEVPISINDIMTYIVSRSVLSYPLVNSHFHDMQITEYKHVNLGCAVDTPRGLFVPVIKNAHTLSLMQIAKEIRRLAAKCHDGSIERAELTGGTFTVSNLGAKGVDYFTPILNVPETSLLGIGTIRLVPVHNDEKEVEFQSHICLSFTFDHQAYDGMYAANFLQNIAHNIKNIDMLFFDEVLYATKKH